MYYQAVDIGMAESQRVNVTVPESMYAEWQEAVEEEGVAASISELIRNSVNRNLDGHLGSTESQQGTAQAAPSEEMMKYLQNMDTTLTAVEERLERLEEESRTTSGSSGVNLQKVVHKVLPEKSVPPTLPEDDLMDEIERESLPSTETIARQIDADFAEVLDALIKLEPRDPSVVSYEAEDGTTYWWREP